MDIAALRAEIQNDPASLGYAALVAAENDLGIADLLNGTYEPDIGWVTRNDFLIWSATTIRAEIEDAANNSLDALRSSALVLRSICDGATDGIDFAKQQNVDLLDAWVSAGKITATDKTELLALATKQSERSMRLFGQLVTANHVARAVRDDAGNTLIAL